MLPIVAGVPAHPTTTDSGRTVTPERPVSSGKNNGSNIREGDPVDDQTGTFTKDFTFPYGGTKHIKVRVPLPNTGPAKKGTNYGTDTLDGGPELWTCAPPTTRRTPCAGSRLRPVLGLDRLGRLDRRVPAMSGDP
jgi:hypothetical protein